LDTLAMAFAEAGRFEEAVSSVQNAMRLLEQGGAAEESKLLEPHLAKFKSRQPWRENISAPQ